MRFSHHEGLVILFALLPKIFDKGFGLISFLDESFLLQLHDFHFNLEQNRQDPVDQHINIKLFGEIKGLFLLQFDIGFVGGNIGSRYLWNLFHLVDLHVVDLLEWVVSFDQICSCFLGLCLLLRCAGLHLFFRGLHFIS